MQVRRLDQFNIVILGTGGQGLITLLQILAEAALIEGKEIRTSELHGLAQRGGSVEVHIRFGKKIYSPMVSQGGANLILGLEMQETLKGIYFTNKRTSFLINKHIVPIPLIKPLTEKQVLAGLRRFNKNIQVIPAGEICQKKLSNILVAGIYLIGLAVFKGLIPLKPASLLKAIKKTIPAKYLELNLKAFNLASNSEAVR